MAKVVWNFGDQTTLNNGTCHTRSKKAQVLKVFCFCSSLTVLIGIIYYDIFPITYLHMSFSSIDSFVMSKPAKNNITRAQEHKNSLSSLSELKEDLTVVTAYYDIGKFDKGHSNNVFTPKLYHGWFRTFAYIENPLIVYVDSKEDANRFRAFRSEFPKNMTKIILLPRNSTHSFSLLPNISEIFSQEGYPRFTPNTVVPSYSAAMNLKYEVMQMAIDDNPFRTKYFCWLDIGLFRDLVADHKSPEPFGLYLPDGFQEESISYAEVEVRNSNLTAKEIVYNNCVWVCGCFFVGRWDIMRTWTVEYLAEVDALVARKLLSTDQQTMYIMANEKTMKTKLQLYEYDGQYLPWFHLGYMSRDVAMKRKRMKQTTQFFTMSRLLTTGFTPSKHNR